MPSLKEFLEKADLSAVALPNDKLEECKYFYALLMEQNDRNNFRWLLSAFLNACYGYLEAKASYFYHARVHPETGEPEPDEGSLEILRQYVKAYKQSGKRAFIKTSGLTELTEKLYELRNRSTHDGGLSIMQNKNAAPFCFEIGFIRGGGIPAVEFCNKVLELFETLESEL